MTEIFVFGSNTQGRHGKGAALYAKDHYGAVYGIARGPQGRAYAIITKDLTKEKELQVCSIPLDHINEQVNRFMEYARKSVGKFTFKVAAIGCGLAGYTPEEIAPMFKDAPSNVKLPQVFLDVLNK